MLVVDILEKFSGITGQSILDVGCGEGGTSKALREKGAVVSALDIRGDLQANFLKNGIQFYHGSIGDISFSKNRFDIIILQDVLEHLKNPGYALGKTNQILKRNGLLFISTPNRFSILNAFSDPHWQLPLVALFPRPLVRFSVRHIFRKDRRQRDDWAALLSLNKLLKIMRSNGFEPVFVNKQVAEILFRNPQAVVCASWHLKIIHYLKKNQLENMVQRMVNDNIGIFNYLINPTWYLIGKKR